jgi:hypothetical protein
VKRLLLVLVACKESPPPPPPTPTPIAAPDAAVIATDWDRCKAALAGAPKLPAPRRASALIEACTPCGDWTPLLDWQKLRADGGPTRDAIEAAMLACKAYCDPNAKQRFLGTLDGARGKHTRGPWRWLGEMCKAEVSALPDARYVTAPYFALDRIARAVAAKPDLAPLLDAIEIPLPAVSVTGAGIELLESPGVAPEPGGAALTVSDRSVQLAVMPRARLGAQGVTVLGNHEQYPGLEVPHATAFAERLEKLGASDPIALFAPPALPARRLLDALALTGKHEVRFAAQIRGAPTGWELTGTVPVALATKGAAKVTLALGASADEPIKEAKARQPELAGGVAITLGKDATVAGLAKLVGALVYFDVKRVVVTRGKP